MTRDKVCIAIPRWFRADGSTTLPITVSGGPDRRLDLTLTAVTGVTFPDGRAQTARMRRDVALRTAEPSISPTGDGDVRLEVEIAGRNVIYRAEVGGPAHAGLAAIWARIKWAFIPTSAWLALYVAAALIWVRFGAVKELPPAAAAHYERPVVDGTELW